MFFLGFFLQIQIIIIKKLNIERIHIYDALITRLKFNLMLNFKRSFIQAKIEFTRCFTFVFRAGVCHTFLHLVRSRGRREPERYPLIAK